MTMTSPPPITELPVPENLAPHRLAPRPGLEVVAGRRGRIPLVEVRVVLPITRREPAAAEVLAEVLRRSGPQPAAGLERLLADHGADLRVAAGPGELTVAATVPQESIDAVLPLVGELLCCVRFDPATVARAAALLGARREAEERRPAHRMRLALLPAVGGEPPPRSIDLGAVNVTTVRELWSHAIQTSTTVVGVSAADPGVLAQRLAAVAWPAGVAEPARPPHPAVHHRHALTVVEAPGSAQTSLGVGATLPPRGERSHGAAALAVAVLGGSSTARLSRSLRERHGYSYSPFATLEISRGHAVMVLDAAVNAAVSAASLSVIREEIHRLRTEPVPVDELTAARRAIEGRLARATHTQAGAADRVAWLAARGSSPDDDRRLTEQLRSVTGADVCAASSDHLADERLAVVAVGDPVALATLA